jgi:CheY-like chemotaxis protein
LKRGLNVNSEESAILVVDDEPALREIFSLWVESMSCGRVLTAEDGLDALKVLEQSNVVLLITDIRMPGMDGVTLVRKTSERAQIPSIIFVSAYTDVDEREMYALGAETFLTKPLRKEDLTLAVMKALTPRAKQWRDGAGKPARQVINITSEEGLSSLTLGRGGFCARYSGSIALGRVDFDYHSAERGESFRGSGMVRWRSRSEGLIGVEFTYLDDSCRESVVNQIHNSKVMSYIPKEIRALQS